MNVAELVPDWGREWRYRTRLCREAYARGRQSGWEAGRRALLEELAAAQRVACGPAVRALEDPDYGVFEVRRWGAGGRAAAGRVRVGDYGGGPVVW